MPFDGSGNFNRVMNWVADASASIKIKADRHDQEDDNLAQGLSNTITKDGQSQPTANIPMNGKRLVNLGPPVNPTDAATKAYSDLDTIHPAADKTTLVDADEIGLSNSASVPPWQRAKISWANFKTLINSGWSAMIHAAAQKATLVDADEFGIADSVSTPTTFLAKRHTWANLKTMVGITAGQRLGPTQGTTPVTDLNNAIESGWYVHTNTAANAPIASHGFLEVIAYDASSILQLWTSLDGTTSFQRRKSTTWGAWNNVTAINALLKDKDGVIVDAGYTMTPRTTPDAPAGGAYTPTPVGGLMRQVNSVGTAWTFNAPTFTGNYTMTVLINNAAISGAVTFAGFNRVTGPAHPTALGKWSVVYITKVGAVKTAFIEASP